MEEILVICGPTATGKTSLAINFAKKFNGEIVSADSRQVYKHLDIGTGKDLPKNMEYRVSSIEFKDIEVGYYSDGKIRLWGYDLVEPTVEFSVANYLSSTEVILADIYKRGKLPIIVGGTGLYIRAITEGIPTAVIPKNPNLRRLYLGKSAIQLQEILARLNPIKFAFLNQSDRMNPRRLIRAIEIEENINKHKIKTNNQRKFDPLLIGLTADKEFIRKRIEKRVNVRIKQGIENEIKGLIESGLSWEKQSMNTLGYKEWRQYFENGKSREEVINEWIKDEINYAKRQMTWFKKVKDILWFDIEKSGWQKVVESVVRRWHNK